MHKHIKSSGKGKNMEHHRTLLSFVTNLWGRKETKETKETNIILNIDINMLLRIKMTGTILQRNCIKNKFSLKTTVDVTLCSISGGLPYTRFVRKQEQRDIPVQYFTSKKELQSDHSACHCS